MSKYILIGLMAIILSPALVSTASADDSVDSIQSVQGSSSYSSGSNYTDKVMQAGEILDNWDSRCLTIRNEGTPSVRVLANVNAFQQNRMFLRHPHFRSFLPPELFVRRLVIMDSNDNSNRMTIRNSIHGDNTVNEIRMVLNSSEYNNLFNWLNANQKSGLVIDSSSNRCLYGNTIVQGINMTIR